MKQSAQNQARPDKATLPQSDKAGDTTYGNIHKSLKTIEKLVEVSGGANQRPSSSEVRPGPGFRVKSQFERAEASVIDRLSQFETTDISDALNRMFTMDSAIRNVVSDAPLFGPAVTVKVFPGDNLMVHKALDVAKPGDILVVDTSGAPHNAIVGDMIANKARHKKIAGMIIDGLVRDLPGIVEAGLPIYAKGITAFGPLHRGPGEVGYSISCGGIVVNPGDVICADKSGIVVVRQEFADETAGYLEDHNETLSAYVEKVKQGDFCNDWVDRQLTADGCLFE